MNTKNIAIFASGSGSNAEKIFQHFKGNKEVKVVAVLSNKADAGVIARAEKAGIESRVFTKAEFDNADVVVAYLKQLKVDIIVLAGFLKQLTPKFIASYPNHIVNIHPALLPKYGGKGMYGNHVHEAVVNNGDTESGITIHLVNENYDEGEIIFQSKCDVPAQMGAKQLAATIQQLEHQHYPTVIEKFLETFEK